MMASTAWLAAMRVSHDELCRYLRTLARRLCSSCGCSFCTSPSWTAAARRVTGEEPVSRSRNRRSSLLVMLPVEHRCRMDTTVSKHAHNSGARSSALSRPLLNLSRCGSRVPKVVSTCSDDFDLVVDARPCQKAIVAHESTSRHHRCKGHHNRALPQGAGIERCLGSGQNACLPRANGDLPFAFVVHFGMHRFGMHRHVRVP